MLTGYSATQDRNNQRFIGCCLLLLFLGLSFSLPTRAQQDPPLSDSVVLVLKLVSKTHVKPTTGIVVSTDGLVLVPAYLIKEPGEIVVLDNGVDIAVNGRPATIVDKPSAGGLALLRVEGLERPAIVLSANALDADRRLHLETFPPAKFMAKGAKPLWVPVSMIREDAISRVSVSPETPLPYVTGPIIDECGYLAGLSLALGPQSLELDKFPVVVFTDELSQVFDTMQLDLTLATCQDTSLDSANSTIPQESGTDSNDKPPEAEKIKADTADEVIPPQGQTQAQQNSAEDLSFSDDPVTVGVVKPSSIWLSTLPWLLLLGIIGIAVLIWKGVLFRRQGSGPGQRASTAVAASSYPSAAEEPDTAQLASHSDASVVRPRSVPVDEADIADLADLPEGCDAVILIEGWLDPDTPFKRYCAIKAEKIDLVIGRGQANINIEHPAISREHVRLVSDKELMTISDLGSSNGTFINNTPCLSGEIMFTASDDEIFLGQVRLHISVITNLVGLK